MSNPLANLSGKKFDSLTTSEMVQVINTYFDENRFFNLLTDENDVFTSARDVVKYFEGVCHSEYDLRLYFKNWTE